MRKNFHSKTVSEIPTSPRKPLPTLPNLIKSNNNNSKPLPSPRGGAQTFVAISNDEEELLSLLSMEGTRVSVIGLWEETSPLLSNNSTSLNSTTGITNNNNQTTTTTSRRLPPPLPPKLGSSSTNNNRRLSKINFDTTCFISEDGQALVCESDLTGPMGMQKRSNIILFSEVEKIVPYFQSEILIGNVSDSTVSPRQSTSSNPYQITTQEARECISYFERYFISGYDNNDREFQKSILPFKFQLFILKRKNHKKTLGFILSGMFFQYHFTLN